ncbi:tyrosine-protein phosphatase [Actinomadura xylanilytica]|uniref:tyrosine-protein phosphatase n=1 Tax=Actinomadura xylanilytica TaxID=887459 RepID=UPI00255AA8DC|nr:tyrosine-protein phosphatase [Actinomadura xylanilytica]MDL4776826.1 tyrosine-protein phosphatase [Actinomadura xylanilytica]
MRTPPSRARLPRVLLAASLVSGAGAITAAPAHAAVAARPAGPAAGAVAGIPFVEARAERAADGSHLITWASPAATVNVTAFTDPDATQGGSEVGSGPGNGQLTVPAGRLPAAARWYFRLTPDQGRPLIVAERSAGIETARNFRDVGGYRTTDGHWVRTGMVYRSNKLSSTTPADQQRMTDLGITLDVDLRNISERRDDPDRLPAGVRYQVADVADLTHGVKFHDPALMTLAEALLAGLLSGSSDLGQSIGYPFMVNFTGADRAYRDLLNATAANNGATVFHCSSGKDRTGWGTAVLLTILGVPRATVEADYLASNTYLGRDDAVQIAWLRAAFDEADDLYGSFDAYVKQGLELDDATIAALRAKLLTS